MALLSFLQVSLNFGFSPLFEKISFSVLENERICLIGRNGMGKSTLLKLITGECLPDSGEIVRSQGLLCTKLQQDVPQDLEGRVFDIVARPLLQHKEVWEVQTAIEALLKKCDIQGDALFQNLSGGQKRRVLLAKALSVQPDILLLDEPTNHLDIPSIIALENLLKEFKGTLIFITHDRSFLQNLATRILEIDRGHLRSFNSTFAQYLEQKQQILETEEKHNQLFDKKLAQEEVWIRQGIKARRTRNEGRVRALQALRKERSQRRGQIGNVNMQVQNAPTSGKMVLEAIRVSYQYDQQKLIDNFSLLIERGDKIGIIGPNGVGKTTLIKILLGLLKPDSGRIRQGTQLEIAYFDQLRAEIDENKTVAQNISYGEDFVTINNKSLHVISYLQDFLFTPDRAKTSVKNLSGGERNRLLLARLFSKPANFLVLDEPTNDLDMETLELLEEHLIQFDGSILLISHDRSFLNNVVTSTLVFEGQGKISEYVGGYDDWLRQSPNQSMLLSAEKPSASSIEAQANTNKENYQNAKKIRSLEQKIESLEKKVIELQDALADPELYLNEKLTSKKDKLQKDLEQKKLELTDCMQQWENLI